jgi:hypothetical protein
MQRKKSRRKNGLSGNDTIHRYPLSCEGKLTKLLCISKEVFEKLTLTAREFFIKERIPKSAPARIKPCKMPVLATRRKGKARYQEYTPTPIWYTRCSEYWQWQRVSEWWREYGQDEIINEKRHILL